MSSTNKVMTTKRCYIAGKISDLPEAVWRGNFEQAKVAVQKMGLEPVSPIELPHQHNQSWQACMREDLMAMLTCDYVYAQDNWTQSKGATLEITLARALGMEVIGFPAAKQPPSPILIQLKVWRWQLRTWWRQTHCPHKNATEIARYPQDNFIVYRCHDCDKEIFDDLHPN